MRRWTKRVSMVIAFKADMMSQAALEAQTSVATPEARGQEALNKPIMVAKQKRKRDIK